MKREHAEVGDVGQHVEQRDPAGSEDQRERQVTPRVLHLGRGKRHVVPGVRRKERADEAAPKARTNAGVNAVIPTNDPRQNSPRWRPRVGRP